jgi:hypothetical protein
MRSQRILEGGGYNATAAARQTAPASASGGRTATGEAAGRRTASGATAPDFARELSESSATHPFATGPGALSAEDKALVDRIAKAVGAPAEQLRIEERPSERNYHSNGTRQFIVTIEPEQNTPATILMPGSQERVLPLAEDAADFNYDAIAMVKDRLIKAGVDPSTIQFEYRTDVVNNVGGQRTFHLIRADLGNGIKEDFSLEWTLYNPDITAVEIERLLGRPRLNGPRVS